MIVDDVPLFRRGIRHALERMGDCTIVGESTDPAEIMEVARTHHPDVVLIDGGLGSVDAIEIAWGLRQQASTIGIFIFAPSPDEERLFQFVKVGASAYEMRTITPEALVDKVRRVSNGEYLITSEVLWRFPRVDGSINTRFHLSVKANEIEIPTSPSPLSRRELEILGYIAEGNSNKVIARVLCISDQTVKNHITSTLKKLEVDDRTSAVVYALRQRWIRLWPQRKAS